MSNMNFFPHRLLSRKSAILGLSIAAIASGVQSGASLANTQSPWQYPQASKAIPHEPPFKVQPVETATPAAIGAIAPSSSDIAYPFSPLANTLWGDRDSQNKLVANALVSIPPLTAQQPAATRYVEVREVKGIVTYGPSMQIVKVGQRLQSGQQEFSTGPNSSAFLQIDNLIGTIELAENTTIRVKTLSSGKTSFYAVRGRVRSSIGNPSPISSFRKTLGVEGEKSLLAQSDSSSGNYPVDIETPAGIAGVQGTSFGVDVGPDGKTAIATVDGTVAAIAQGKTVLVNRGMYVVIGPGLAPTQPQPSPKTARFRVISAKRVGTSAVRVVGQAGSLDLVYINDRPIRTDLDGKFSTVVQVPVSRRVRFVVRGPATTETVYEIAVL